MEVHKYAYITVTFYFYLFSSAFQTLHFKIDVKTTNQPEVNSELNSSVVYKIIKK